MTAPVTSEAIVPVAAYQQVPGSDLTAMGSLGQGSLDNVVEYCLIAGVGYAGMSAAQVGTSSIVAIQPGYLIKGGPAYSLRDPFNVDVSSAIAQVPDNTKTAIVAIVADGQVFPSEETRTFVISSKLPTDPTQPAPTVTLATPTRNVRSVVISSPVGTPDVQPSLPGYSANLCLIATVVVSNTAIVSVTQSTDSQITRLDQLVALVTELNDFQSSTNPILDYLKSTVSALALQLANGFANINAQLALLNTRVSALEQRTTAATGAVLKGVDYFTDETESLTSASGYNCLVNQGLQFPPGSFQDLPLVAQNPYASSVTSLGYKIMPAYTEVTGAQTAAFAPGGLLGLLELLLLRLFFNNFANYAATTSLRSFSVSRVRWAANLLQASTAQLQSNGDPSRIFAVQPSDFTTLYNLAGGPWLTPTTELTRNLGFWRDLASRGFWTPISATGTTGAQPAIVQGYVSAGAQMITSVELGIEKKGSSGDARLIVMRDLNGQPDPTKVVADVTVAFANLGSTSTKFQMPYPILKDGGATIWFVVLTNGSHGLRCVPAGQKGVLGAPVLVWTNGGWTIVTSAVEIAMRVNVAQFAGGVTRVQLNALGLTGGIDSLDIVASSIVPQGCSVDYEVQIGGVYVPVAQVAAGGAHPLSSRPSNLPINMILSGTTSVSPIVDLTYPNTKARVSRQSTAMQHNSISQTPPVTVHTVDKTAIVDNWNAATQTLTASLLTGTGYATANAPTAVVDAIQADGSLLRTWTWSIGGGVTSFEMKLVGTTTDSTSVFSLRQSNWDAVV